MGKVKLTDVINKLQKGKRTSKRDAGVLQAAGFDDPWVIRRVSSGKATKSDANRVSEWFGLLDKT